MTDNTRPDERAAFDEFWRERCAKSWRLTLASDERDKPVPQGWGGAFKRESWDAFQAGRASLCAPHADRCTRCGRYEDGQRPCPNGDSQCPVSASAAQPGVMQQWREEAERLIDVYGDAAAYAAGEGFTSMADETSAEEAAAEARAVLLAHLSAVPTKE